MIGYTATSTGGGGRSSATSTGGRGRCRLLPLSAQSISPRLAETQAGLTSRVDPGLAIIKAGVTLIKSYQSKTAGGASLADPDIIHR